MSPPSTAAAECLGSECGASGEFWSLGGSTRLSAVDERFADFAAANGVECGPLPEAERQRLRVDINARVARAWGLPLDDLRVIFEDFTLDAVTPAYRSALVERLEELG